jgi:hypothetical protein
MAANVSMAARAKVTPSRLREQPMMPVTKPTLATNSFHHCAGQ